MIQDFVYSHCKKRIAKTDDGSSDSNDESDERTRLLPSSSRVEENDVSSFAARPVSSSLISNSLRESDEKDAVPDKDELVIHIVRQPGTGLGMSIAGGIGSTPYKNNDRVRTEREI